MSKLSANKSSKDEEQVERAEKSSSSAVVRALIFFTKLRFPPGVSIAIVLLGFILYEKSENEGRLLHSLPLHVLLSISGNISDHLSSTV